MFFLAFFACVEPGKKTLPDEPGVQSNTNDSLSLPAEEVVEKAIPKNYLRVNRDVYGRDYFEYMDSLATALDSVLLYEVDEYMLVHANPWVLDTLVNQDYYLRMEKGEFVKDQKALVVLHRGDSLEIPSPAKADSISAMLRSVTIDVNIPEYTLRILLGDSVLHRVPVRIGKNKSAYLAMAGREINLQTPVGEGEIIRIERDPWYINPVDNKRYKSTRRDDGRYTELPKIPFLEPTIDGRRQGSLLHPTTNLSTLEKAVSNGCVGMREADAWRVYYYAPIGTRVVFRYDLEGLGETGDPVTFRDVYGWKGKRK